MATELDKSEMSSVMAALAAVDVIRKADKEMPAQTLQAILEIAKEPGMAQADLQLKLNLTTAAVSRIVKRLSQYTPDGLNFVDARPNPLDRRYAILHPTPKGMAFIRRLIGAAHK